jgi:multicomponent Na+:H+ antiporter subunit D
MMAVPAVLLLGAALFGLIPGAVPGVARAAARLVDHRAYARWVLGALHVRWPGAGSVHVSSVDVLYAVLAVVGALAVAALGLFGRPLREALPGSISSWARTWVRAIRYMHSGHIGDYIAWWTVGASLMGAACLLALT